MGGFDKSELTPDQIAEWRGFFNEQKKLPDVAQDLHDAKDRMMNTAEERWEDYKLITTVKNMLLCIERQYNDFHGELAKLRDALSEHSEDRKDKAYEKIQNMEYQSKKMEHL